MTILGKLTFTKEMQAINDRTAHVRSKFVDGVNVQLEALTAEVEGKPFKLTKEHREKNEETGEVTKIEKEVRFSVWWTKGVKGYSVEPRYGSKRIQLSVMGSIIQTGEKLSDVKAVLELLIQAANAGELDKPLLEVSERKSKTEQKPETPTTGSTERTTRGH
ncbi:hypothetical protein GOB86_13585 [Acetobacter lambici]|uniref:Phage protein n=1 Tax=Acetobacter lambici TaxID=1332824 RepID=A0ABT1F407_9PROT|nr:hypothetical protein [Acetobacter lambici]MCP1243839.1 hypothetical protein [Acetobacter lambici]MCP1259947.1 hypothetical protein [Acetobacter lambici]NHO58062.1 hypothetical protein [Acetobacter lambici]